MESYQQNSFQSPGSSSYNYNYNQYSNYYSNYPAHQYYNSDASYNYASYYSNYSLSNDSGYDTSSYLSTSPSPSAPVQSTQAYQHATVPVSPISTNQSGYPAANDDHYRVEKRSFSDVVQEAVTTLDESEVTATETSKAKRPKIAKLDNLNSKNVTYRCVECYRDFNSAARYLMHQHKYHFKRSSTECPICCKLLLF